MGTTFTAIHGYHEYSPGTALPESPRQVLSLAVKVVQPIAEAGWPTDLSHLVAATTCPDTLAPSLAQGLIERFSDALSGCHSVDIVQGCSGGVTALILGSQLAGLYRSSVLVVLADAANKSTSKSSRLNKNFGNGSFACLIRYEDSLRGLLHTRSKHYKGLSEVVHVGLGHDADRIIMKERKAMETDPRKHLGLQMNNKLAIKLIRQAEPFFLDFTRETGTPDMMILHQVNPMILTHLASVFKKHQPEFVNVVEKTGNCGVASVGLGLYSVREQTGGKRVFLCSFGTGGVITAGLWQM